MTSVCRSVLGDSEAGGFAEAGFHLCLERLALAAYATVPTMSVGDKLEALLIHMGLAEKLITEHARRTKGARSSNGDVTSNNGGDTASAPARRADEAPIHKRPAAFDNDSRRFAEPHVLPPVSTGKPAYAPRPEVDVEEAPFARHAYAGSVRNGDVSMDVVSKIPHPAWHSPAKKQDAAPALSPAREHHAMTAAERAHAERGHRHYQHP